MIKYNNKKRKMEYGMSFDPDWNQGSTATIVQGQRTDDKVAENLAKTVQVVSAIGGIAGSLKKPGATSISAKKEGETPPAIIPNSTASKPEDTEVMATEKEDKDIIGGLKTGFNNFTSKLKDKFPDLSSKKEDIVVPEQESDTPSIRESKSVEKNPFSLFKKRMRSTASTKTFAYPNIDTI